MGVCVWGGGGMGGMMWQPQMTMWSPKTSMVKANAIVKGGGVTPHRSLGVTTEIPK